MYYQELFFNPGIIPAKKRSFKRTLEILNFLNEPRDRLLKIQRLTSLTLDVKMLFFLIKYFETFKNEVSSFKYFL